MSIDIEKIFDFEQYSLSKKVKQGMLVDLLEQLCDFHAKNCGQYGKLLQNMNYSELNTYSTITQLQFIPVRLFKDFNLFSCKENEIIRVLKSSGTTGSEPSKIYLSNITASLQTKALVDIVKNVLGNKRLPMLIIDSKSVLSNDTSFSARVAGILGFANFGRDHTYVLDENMELDLDILNGFLERHKGEKIFIFGFTFMIWKSLYMKLNSLLKKIDLSNAILIHGGGWKKLLDLEVSNEDFKSSLKQETGLSSIYNFYGMVEQVGSIFIECDFGMLHTPNYADVIVRNPYDWSPCDYGEEGIIEVLSVLPQSYPGNAILTEDIGTIYGEDNCLCGKMGRYFKIKGRIPKSEVRGCSDTQTI